jgi:hypothetical protein
MSGSRCGATQHRSRVWTWPDRDVQGLEIGITTYGERGGAEAERADEYPCRDFCRTATRCGSASLANRPGCFSIEDMAEALMNSFDSRRRE